MTADPRPAPAGDPDFQLWRELDRLDRRIEKIDQDGPRGLTALQQTVTQLATDLATHERRHEEERREMERRHEEEAREAANHRRWLIGTLVSVVLFVVGPLYPLLLSR